MRALLISLFLTLTAPNIGQADITLDEAVVCFDTMLADAKGGASFSVMVERYVSLPAVATRAVQVQKGIIWRTLNKTERKPYLAAVTAYFAAEKAKVDQGIGKNDYVVIDTVALNPRYHKKVNGGYQLAGEYTSQGGSDENFALYIVKEDGRCLIYDARWRTAWLSKFIALP